MRSLLVFALLVCAASAASAQQPPKGFLEEFQKGTDAYRLGQYDEAKVHLEAAKKLDPQLPGPWRFLAAVAQAEQDWATCITSAREAIRLNPRSAEIAATRQLHDQCRTAAGKAEFGGTYEVAQDALSVTSDQLGAEVTIGGLKYGSTPMAPRVFAVGEVEVKVEKSGYLAATRKVEVLPEIVTDVDFVLEVDPEAAHTGLGTAVAEITQGWIKVETGAPGAVVRIDGKVSEIDENGRYPVDEGGHEVEVSAPEHEPIVKTVRVIKGQLVTVRAPLRSQASVDKNRRLGNVFIGAGTGLVVAGAVTALLSLRASDQARDWWVIETTRPSLTVPTEDIHPLRTRADIDDKVDQAKRYSLISNISYGAAAVAIGVGAYFLVKSRPAGEKKTKAMTVVPLLDGEGGLGAAAIGEVRW